MWKATGGGKVFYQDRNEVQHDQSEFALPKSPSCGIPGQEVSALQRQPGTRLRKVVPEHFETRRRAPHFPRTTNEKAELDDLWALIRSESESGKVVFNNNASSELKVSSGCFYQNSHFLKKAEIGSGINGPVTRYLDTTSQKTFARKEMKAKKLREKEIESMLRMDHPNICKILALLYHESAVDLLLQDAGKPLGEYLKLLLCSNKILPNLYFRIVKDLTVQGFQGIKYMHSKDICHLDVKPDNQTVHLDEKCNPVLVLVDFGSSLKMGEKMNFSMPLTRQYWSPEMWLCVREFWEKKSFQGQIQWNACEFVAQPSCDEWAMNMCAFYMCRQQHFLHLLVAQNLRGNVRGLRIDDRAWFFLEQTVMTEQQKHLPSQAAYLSRGLFPGSPPPSSLMEVMTNMSQAEPTDRWKCQQAIAFLSEMTEDSQAETERPVAATSTAPYGTTSAQVEDEGLDEGRTDLPTNRMSTVAELEQKLAYFKCWDISVNSQPKKLATPNQVNGGGSVLANEMDRRESQPFHLSDEVFGTLNEDCNKRHEGSINMHKMESAVFGMGKPKGMRIHEVGTETKAEQLIMGGSYLGTGQMSAVEGVNPQMQGSSQRKRAAPTLTPTDSPPPKLTFQVRSSSNPKPKTHTLVEPSPEKEVLSRYNILNVQSTQNVGIHRSDIVAGSSCTLAEPFAHSVSISRSERGKMRETKREQLNPWAVDFPDKPSVPPDH